MVSPATSIEETYSSAPFQKHKKRKLNQVEELKPLPKKTVPTKFQSALGRRRPDRMRSPKTADPCSHLACHDGNME